MIIKETLVDLQERYEKVRKLLERDARFDPDTQPYLSKYSATMQLKSMNAVLEGLREKQEKDSEEYLKLIGMQAVVALQLATIAIETEETSKGEEYLSACSALTTPHARHPLVASCHLHMLNQFGMLHANRGSPSGRTFLEQAQTFYTSIKEQGIRPVDFNDVFNSEPEAAAEAEKKFEKLYTLTLYYLAQVFAKVDHLKSAIFCHKTLRRQLESGEFEVIDWVLNTATLSQFMTEKNGFKQARHHLSASSYILDQHKAALEEEEDSEEHRARVEVYKHRSADVARCWANYAIRLLVNSKERLLNAEGDELGSACTDFAKLHLSGENDLSFPSLDLKEYEGGITDQFLLTVEDARPVFLHGRKSIARAQEYYKLDTMASDYIEIAQDHAKLYDALVFFEEAPENRTKLLKRAIDILEEVLTNVNPTYYKEYCRAVWFRTGMLYSDILDIKLDRIKESQTRPTKQALSKINKLVDSSVKNFEDYIESFRSSSGEFPGKVSENHEKAFLQAVFHVAALQSRRVTLDRAEQVENARRSLEGYQRLVEYCGANGEAEAEVRAEVAVAREMVVLLPLKIAKSL